MILKKGEDYITMPGYYYELLSIAVQLPDGIRISMHEISPTGMGIQKERNQELSGVPMEFARSNDPRIDFFPKADRDYEIGVRYTTIHEL